jgi:hypothetical protein
LADRVADGFNPQKSRQAPNELFASANKISIARVRLSLCSTISLSHLVRYTIE